MMTSEKNTVNINDLYLMMIIESYLRVIENKLAKNNNIYKENLLKLKQYLEDLRKTILSENNHNKLHIIKDALSKIFKECKHLYNGRGDKVNNLINEMKNSEDASKILKVFDKFLLLTYIDFSHNNENMEEIRG